MGRFGPSEARKAWVVGLLAACGSAAQTYLTSYSGPLDLGDLWQAVLAGAAGYAVTWITPNRWQITLPAEARKQLRIKEGDRLEVDWRLNG